VARAALQEGLDAFPAPKLDLRLLVDHRERLVRHRVELNSTLLWHLHDLLTGDRAARRGVVRDESAARGSAGVRPAPNRRCAFGSRATSCAACASWPRRSTSLESANTPLLGCGRDGDRDVSGGAHPKRRLVVADRLLVSRVFTVRRVDARQSDWLAWQREHDRAPRSAAPPSTPAPRDVLAVRYAVAPHIRRAFLEGVAEICSRRQVSFASDCDEEGLGGTLSAPPRSGLVPSSSCTLGWI
jgi:hypothetical protein